MATVLGSPSASTDACLLCGATDEAAEYGPRLMLCCTSCEASFSHLACEARQRNGPLLTEEQARAGWVQRLPSSLHLPPLPPSRDAVADARCVTPVRDR